MIPQSYGPDFGKYVANLDGMHSIKRARQPKFFFFALAWAAFIMIAPLCIGEEHHEGYLASVKEERRARIVEMLMVSPPPKEKGPLMADVIFDARLKREFQKRYTTEFGTTQFERNVETPTRYDQFQYSNGTRVTEQEYEEKKQRFGEYMVRRLTEHHVDGYLKTNPSTKQIYVLKEKLSKIQLKVKQGYNVKLNYSFSANVFTVELKNPYEIENQVLFQMNPDSTGPSEVTEAIWTVGVPLKNKIKLYTNYKAQDGIVDLVGVRPLSRTLSASLTGTTYTKDEGESIREHRLLFALSWTN